jgi:hypothetical protein
MKKKIVMSLIGFMFLCTACANNNTTSVPINRPIITGVVLDDDPTSTASYNIYNVVNEDYTKGIVCFNITEKDSEDKISAIVGIDVSYDGKIWIRDVEFSTVTMPTTSIDSLSTNVGKDTPSNFCIILDESILTMPYIRARVEGVGTTAGDDKCIRIDAYIKPYE